MSQRTLHVSGLDLRINLVERNNDEGLSPSHTKPVKKKKMVGFREFMKAYDEAASSTPTNKSKGSER